MLFSAFKRLGLYEEVYGFSRLRTYTHVFLIWLGLLLIVTVALEVLRREHRFTFAMLIASLGFAISLPILNVDEFIVEKNIQREIQAQTKNNADLDTEYFLDLSDDAVPALVSAYQSPNLPEPVRERIGVSLACIHYNRGLDTSELQWQSFHFATLNADKTLASIKSDLKEFKINATDYPIMVTTPAGEEFSCSTYYYD
jgi:hypothetical protein